MRRSACLCLPEIVHRAVHRTQLSVPANEQLIYLLLRCAVDDPRSRCDRCCCFYPQFHHGRSFWPCVIGNKKRSEHSAISTTLGCKWKWSNSCRLYSRRHGWIRFHRTISPVFITVAVSASFNIKGIRSNYVIIANHHKSFARSTIFYPTSFNLPISSEKIKI